MTRFESVLASLVAAIPVGTMTAQVVMSLLSHSEKMSTLMTGLMWGTTILGSLVAIGLPSFLLVSGSSKADQDGASASSGKRKSAAAAAAPESVEDAPAVSDEFESESTSEEFSETNLGMEAFDDDSQEFAETVEFDTGDFDMSSNETFGEVDDTDQVIEDEIQFFDDEEEEKPKKKKKK